MNYLEKAADTVLYNPGPWDELLFQTTINWQNMEISTDSWKSLTLPFKAMVKLYELRNAEIDTYMYDLVWGVENSLHREAEDKGFIPESATCYMCVLGQAGPPGTQISTFVR